MDAKNSVVVAQQLVSDLEGLTNSNSHSHSNSGPASKGSLRHSHQLPSLQQFYRLGLLLFRIQEPSKHGKQNETDPVSIAYRQLIARIPEELLRPVFADLLRALKALISGFDKDRRLSSSVSKSGNRPSRGNGNGNANSDGDIGLEDLALAVRSVAGLVGALSKDNDAACSTSCSRLCGLVYDPSWVSALASVYDQLVVAERKQQHQSTATASTTGTGTGTGIQHHKKTVLACLSRLLLDGLVLAAHPPSREYSSSTTLCVEESLLEAIRAMEEESTDCLRDLQAWQASSEPLGRTLEESLCIADRKPTHKNDGDDDDALERAQQREYIASMLESARSQPSSMAISQQASAFGTPLAARSQQVTMTSSSSSSSKPATNPAETELDRRIQQVLQILPHFGEGFVEVALGIHKGDTEATVATLLDDPSNYPTALRVLDAKLPRRKREFRAYQTAAEEQASAQQARADVKERMAQEERRKIAEYEALVVASSSEAGQGAGAGEASVSSVAASDQNQSQNQNQNHKAKPPLSRKELRQQKLKQKLRRAMNEYDDDYDDQYDDVDVKLGATDDGFTADQSSARNANANGNSMTLEQVKLYNKIVQEDESDASFWESNRNTNRPTTNKGKGKGNSGNDDDDDPEENGGTQKQWGRDKIKGGRTIGEDGRIVRKPGGVRKKKNHNTNQQPTKSNNNNNNSNSNSAELSRRNVFAKAVSGAVTAASVAGILESGSELLRPEPASAIGPVKINLLNPTYTAIPCPKDKPIPGEKAMKGMRGLCVTVDVDLEESPDRALDKVGVYGYITDKGTGESVLANNPDLSTDAGQFAIIQKIDTTEKKTQFEFIAAVPSEVDLSPFEKGIAPLNFQSLRVVSFPGGQQYGAISPCEMNEFSDECDAWEAENGPYKKAEYMVKSNERTKGR